jgi:MFS family permease
MQMNNAVAPAPGRHRLFYAALTFLAGILAGYQQTLPVMGRPLQDYYGLNLAQLGLTFSVSMIPAALATALSGLAASHWGPRRILRSGVAGVACGAALACAAGRHWVPMLAALVVFAAGYSTVYVVGQAYLVTLYPDRRRQILALFLSASSLGGILYPLWAEALLAFSRAASIEFGHVLRAPFGALALLMLGIAAYYRRRSPDGAAADPTATVWHRLRLSRQAWLLLTIIMLMGAADTAAGVWMPRVLGERSTAAWLRPGYVSALYCLAYLIARTLLSLAPEGFARRLLVGFPALAGSLLFLGGIATRHTGGLAGGYVIGGLIWSLQLPATLALLSEIEHERFGWVLALHIAGTSAMAFFMTNLMGILGQALDGRHLYAVQLVPAAAWFAAGLLALRWWLGRSADRKRLPLPDSGRGAPTEEERSSL